VGKNVSSIVPKYEKLRVLLALPCTLSVIFFVPQSILVWIILSVFWWAVFRPWQVDEVILFAIAALFFLIQNYVCLRAHIFEFRVKDILLMPIYEPFLWGFYFMTLKRLISGKGNRNFDPDPRDVREIPERKSVIGLLVTSIAFSVFSRTPWFFPATMLSTLFLFMMFHTRRDFYYAGCSLLLGFIVELFGVSAGFWSYPVSDFVGIPLWFAPMWISVGLLGFRFLIPLSRWLATRFELQGA
jgi:hypothetical protein